MTLFWCVRVLWYHVFVQSLTSPPVYAAPDVVDPRSSIHRFCVIHGQNNVRESLAHQSNRAACTCAQRRNRSCPKILRIRILYQKWTHSNFSAHALHAPCDHTFKQLHVFNRNLWCCAAACHAWVSSWAASFCRGANAQFCFPPPSSPKLCCHRHRRRSCCPGKLPNTSSTCHLPSHRVQCSVFGCGAFGAWPVWQYPAEGGGPVAGAGTR